MRSPPSLGTQCVSLPADVSTVEGCRGLAAAYSEKESKLDILVNNAVQPGARILKPFPNQAGIR